MNPGIIILVVALAVAVVMAFFAHNRSRRALPQSGTGLRDLRHVIDQVDSVQTEDMEGDLLSSARQAVSLRGEIDILRAELIRKEAGGEKCDAEKASLKEKENLLRAIERKLNWLRRELYARDAEKYDFLRH